MFDYVLLLNSFLSVTNDIFKRKKNLKCKIQTKCKNKLRKIKGNKS